MYSVHHHVVAQVDSVHSPRRGTSLQCTGTYTTWIFTVYIHHVGAHVYSGLYIHNMGGRGINPKQKSISHQPLPIIFYN